MTARTTTAALTANAEAYAQQQRVYRLLLATPSETAGRTFDPTLFEMYEGSCRLLTATVATAIDASISTGDVIQTVDGALTISHRVGSTVVLTADGQPVFMGHWHEGARSPRTEVRYERWSDGVRTAHGYADAASRRVVQTG
jgi:hypothetical protein